MLGPGARFSTGIGPQFFLATVSRSSSATCSKTEAQSLLPFLDNRPEAEEREYVFSEHVQDLMLQDLKHSLMIRSKRYKLIEYIGKDNGQLFDLESDPDELKDVWSDPDYAEAKTTLRKDLTDWFITSTVDATGWWKNPEATQK